MRELIKAIKLDHESIGEATVRILMMSCAGIICAIAFGMSLGMILIHMARG